jgi:predicted CXXCH cytochrome family protein
VKHSLAQVSVVVIAIALSACSRKARVAPTVARMTSNEFVASIPRVGGPEGYVGSASCKKCHEEQFASWHRSYHRTMTQFADGEAVKADFNNVVLTNENTRFTLMKRGDEHWMRAEPIDVPGKDRPIPIELRMGLVTGSHHMQVFWVPEGHGNMQIGFPFTWLIPERRWVPRNSTFIRPPDLQHRPEVWNLVCSRCHTTGVEPHANMVERRVETRVAELGISCEACHGPGKRHVDLQSASGGPKALEPGEIIHPKEIDPIRASQICGFCHSMKWISDAENWREGGFRFRPGDDLENTTPVIRPSQVDSIPRLRDYLARNPELLNDFFWPDGMIRVSGREYNGLIESPCYKGGKFSCLSCHSLHESEPDDQLAARGKGNNACLQCHDKYQDTSAVAAHTHHPVESTGSECYNCHMPHTTYGVLKAIRSHEISSPRIADELTSGRPNACNLCHLDRTLEWSAKHLADWYQQEKPALPTEATNIARSVYLALAGDAGQRVIVAWHLGWEPALAASGKDWPGYILAQLLDDSYAAVRCVAERSLRNFPGVNLPDFDFTAQPDQRRPVREKVWAKIQNSRQPRLDRPDLGMSRAEALLLSPHDLVTQRNVFDRWVGSRNHRPLRLRE